MEISRQALSATQSRTLSFIGDQRWSDRLQETKPSKWRKSLMISFWDLHGQLGFAAATPMLHAQLPVEELHWRWTHSGICPSGQTAHSFVCSMQSPRTQARACWGKQLTAIACQTLCRELGKPLEVCLLEIENAGCGTWRHQIWSQTDRTD